MIRYCESVSGVTANDLRGFFVGWPNPPSSETHLRLLKGSDRVVLAVEDESGKVVGFITAITDGVLSAYLPLLEVLPEYQGRGIGTELVRRMLAIFGNLYMVDGVCDRALQPFYERFEMKAAVGMMIRRFDRQSGSGGGE